jgi:hypothetical protein
MIERIKAYWRAHTQKTLAAVLMLIDGANLAALQIYHDDIVQFFGPTRGPTVFSGLRMALGALIFWRATCKKAAPLPAPAIEATR